MITAVLKAEIKKIYMKIWRKKVLHIVLGHLRNNNNIINNNNDNEPIKYISLSKNKYIDIYI